ncbi:hypothetical protein HID58_014653 [Brassica napus]|uniref:Uncharacterized protein n=1 Tax=Brassica napus TaxID=3708 RepID=A0ABQ8DKC4_BRANA|nr:hypothetical protein HID58_014653 [Brassica napus]
MRRNLSSSSMVLMVKAPPPSRCRHPPDPPQSELLSVAFKSLTSIIPPEPPDPPDSFFVLVHRATSIASLSEHLPKLGISNLAINSIGSDASPRPSYLSNKPCEGIVYVPLWNKSFLRKVHCDVSLLKLYLPQCEDVTLSLTLRMRSSLSLYEDDELHVSTLLSRCEDVLRTSIMLALFHHSSALWSLGLIAIFDTDLLAMMALDTLMSLLCEIVWNCQDAKDVSLALVGSSLMVGIKPP